MQRMSDNATTNIVGSATIVAEPTYCVRSPAGCLARGGRGVTISVSTDSLIALLSKVFAQLLGSEVSGGVSLSDLSIIGKLRACCV